MNDDDTSTHADLMASKKFSHTFDNMVWDIDSGGYVFRPKSRHFKEEVKRRKPQKTKRQREESAE